MRKRYLLFACTIMCMYGFISCKHQEDRRVALIQAIENDGDQPEHEDENDRYDGPAQRDSLEFEKIKDPALGYVPAGRMLKAIDFTENLKRANIAARPSSTLLWAERGPIYDSVGPSNGNTRGGGGYTSGRMAAVLVDTLDDPTGNTAFCGGIDGGLWKCTNFLSSVPGWQVVNDYFANLAISSICQDPTNPAIMYFSTGEATSNADAVYGGGIYKSTDHGATWAQLPATASFIRSFKILCDAAGNVYLAARTTGTPVSQLAGLLRSNDKGATWTNITPSTVATNSSCTDIEISSTGRLHASFGYLSASGVAHRYTMTPATVSSASGWNSSTGLRTSGVAAYRFEMTCLADTLYGITVNTSYNVDSVYKSIDGGATWTKQNTTALSTGILSGQGWYNVTLAINPANSSEFIVGGLDAYRSTNSGVTIPTRLTYWVTTVPYVHADHHFMQWTITGGESRVVVGCDGGLFLSRDGGVTWGDRNRNLSLKQFYAADIHPAAGSNYLIGGAQDNGCHQLKNAGLSYSAEVTGGDGCFVHINQVNPLIQFGSYVYNQYRRSTDGGNTWGAVNFSGSAGMFVNPWDYDDNNNIMYASWASNTILRWLNANTTTTSNTLVMSGLGTPASFKVSPYTAKRLYIGGNAGKLYRLDNADVATTASLATDLTDITGASFPAGFLNCINVGSSDNTLVAVFTNYGINNVWYSTNGGTSWTAIDGNLPDMPVRWALFVPGHDDQLILATEAGIYTTDAVNGSSTVWSPNPGFPTVRTDMLKLRTSDNTIVAATHGRGLFTATIPTTAAPAINFVTSATNVTEITTNTTGCRNYKDYTVNVGDVNAPTGDATVTFSVQAGNTATQGVDFDFTTNGDFTNPSTQMVFSSGVTAVKTITIRIYDDAQVESTESFTLGFTISGATNAVPGTANTHVVTINDNDFAATPYGVANYAIGTYNNDLTSLNTPFDGTKLKHRLQVLYSAAELKAAGITAAAGINSINLRVKTKNTTKPFNGFTISMANTAANNLNTGFVGITLTQEWTGNYNTVAGDNLFTFATPFAWDGLSNIVVQFCFDNTGNTVEGVTDVAEGNSGPLGSFYASTYANYTTSGAAGCSLAAAYIDPARLDASFNAAFGTKVATVLNTTKTEYLTSNNDLYYYAPTGEIIARIHNLSAQNYGCTQVVVDRAGTGVSQFWNTTPANYLMNKTFHVIPTTNSTTGQYQITLYYTQAEKAGWEAATGQSWNNIQLVKLPSAVSTVTPLNAQPDGPGTVEVVTPVLGTFGSDYTLSYTFSDGFSGFGAGIPGRMNTILTLTGHVDNTTPANIILNWTTSAEINSSSFDVEKSYNGTDFHKIGNVAAAGNKLSPSSYTFTDPENVQVNYYRIKMLHTDGYILYSDTILITNNNAPQGMIVTPNPFVGQIVVRFRRVPAGSIACRLYDMTGKMVKQYPTASSSTNLVTYNFDGSGVLANAIYIFDAFVDGKHYTARVMKK